MNPQNNKKRLANILNGYEKANRFANSEKMKRLRKMTWKDSFNEFLFLCEIGDIQSAITDLKILKKGKIDHLVKVRSLMNKIGKKK